jgi:restriction endonuclease HindI-like protein
VICALFWGLSTVAGRGVTVGMSLRIVVGLACMMPYPLVAKAIAPEGEIIDLFQAAGLKQPEAGTLSDQFLAEVRGLKYKNFAAELRAKQEPHYSIQHELRFIALFLVAAVRAGHNKGLVTSAAKASK